MDTRAAAALTNGRDLGGLPTAAGGRIRPGLLFRSDDTGWAQGQRIGPLPAHMATAFDLRRPEEVADRGLPWFVDQKTRRVAKNLAPVGTVATTITDATQLAAFYVRLLEAQSRNLGDIVREVATTDALPAVVYCVAGKDRTGVVVATLGRLLGVPDDALIEDYAQSARFMAAVRDSGQLGQVDESPVVLPLHDAPAEAMVRFLEEVSARYPNGEDLAVGLGLDPAILPVLRRRYVDGSS